MYRYFHTPKYVITGALFIFSLLLLGATAAYQWSLQPADSSSTRIIRFVVRPGDGVSTIAANLKAAGIIRSAQTFRIYSELTGTRGRLQAGGYALASNQSVADIIDHMSTGKTDQIDVTILPGKTISDLKKDFLAKGFSQPEIDQAFTQHYDLPVLAGIPAGQDYEGYIYPDTYRISAGDKVSVLLQKSFEQLASVISENNLSQRFAAKNLSLHQAMTLASIIQKEAPEPATQRQVAQVFLKRLSMDMLLQSDTTFIYAAKKSGMTPSPSFESPYNTYLHKGLPPGPIENFNLSALLAVADPAPGDYLYFLADKDGKTYFANTLEEHNQNVKKYCTSHCNNY